MRYHRNETNLGAHRNYDRVFELATGKYFKWASCSDICLPGFFEQCVAVLESRPDVVLAYPRTLLVLAQRGEELQTEAYDDGLTLEQESPSARFREYLNREKLNNAMNGIMRAAALRETSLNLPLPGSDISMIAELSLRGKFVEIPERLFVRRFDAETTGILMGDLATAAAKGYNARPGMLQRVRLHSWRFVTAWRAPIGVGEKLRVTLYLLRRVAWLRHQALRKIARILRLR